MELQWKFGSIYIKCLYIQLKFIQVFIKQSQIRLKISQSPFKLKRG